MKNVTAQSLSEIKSNSFLRDVDFRCDARRRPDDLRDDALSIDTISSSSESKLERCDRRESPDGLKNRKKIIVEYDE